MSSVQAWEIVLNCMQKANDGRITRIEAERLLDEYFARIEIVVVEHCQGRVNDRRNYRYRYDRLCRRVQCPRGHVGLQLQDGQARGGRNGEGSA